MNKKSFKFLKVFIFSVLISANMYAASEFDLKERQVLGEDKSMQTEKIKEIKDVKGNENKNNVTLKEDSSNTQNDVKEIKIDGNDVKTSNLIINKPQVIITDNEDRMKENTILFGLGGYRNIDAFKYIVDYTKDFKDKDFTYYIHLARDIKGEDRDNSDVGIDNYYGKIWYKNSSIGLFHTIENTKLPGIKNSTSVVKSTKDDKTTELKFKHTFESNQDYSLKAGIDLYTRDVKSTTEIREFNNDYFDLNIEYEKMMETGKYKNFVKVNGKYLNDNVDLNIGKDGKTAGFLVVAEDKVTISNDPSLIFNLKTGFEAVSKKINENERNLNLGIKAEKLFDDKFGVSVGVEKDGLSASNRETLGIFKLDNDILPVGDFKSEDNITIEASGFYNGKNSFGEMKIRNINSKDKVIFFESTVITNEVPVAATNYGKTVNWTELELKGSYTIKNFRGEIKTLFSTLDEISFVSKNILTATGVYEINKYKTSVAANYYSSMYNLPEFDSQNNKNNRDKLDSRITFDWINSYKINDTMEAGLSVLNIFNEKVEYKNGYPMDGTKVSAEIKVKF